MVIVCLTAALVVTLLVSLSLSLSGDDLIRRYHFHRCKTIVLAGLVNTDGGEPQLSLSREDGATSWSHCLELADPEGYGFLMERVLEGGERDAVAASIAFASLFGNVDRTRQPIAALIIAHESALRARAERAGPSLLQRVVRDLYTHCRNEVRNVKRSTPQTGPQVPGN
jgi:hypothetical protein